MSIQVLLAEDQPVTRAGIRAILQEAPDIEVVGEAKDGAEAQWLADELGPDILLLDTVMPGPQPAETKEEAPETVVEAVRRASRGEVFFSGEQRARAHCWREEVGERWKSLTEREREVLRLLVEGLDNAAIAEALCVTPKTVEYHVTNILSKLGVVSRLEAVVWIHNHLPDDLWKSTG